MTHACATSSIYGMIFPAMPGTDRDGEATSSSDDYEVTLTLHGAMAALVGAVVTIVWVATGAGRFWPMWVWFGLLVSLAVHALGRHLVDTLEGRLRPFVFHAEVTVVVCALEVVIWVMSGGGYFWPIWPLVGLGSLLAVHWMVLNRGWLPTLESAS